MPGSTGLVWNIGDQAAVHDELRTGGVGRLVTGQEHHERGDFLGFTGPPSGMVTMSSGRCSVIGVRMKPGCSELTRMLWRANSSAADFVRPRTAHFEAT